MQALEQFGAPLSQVTAADFQQPDVVFQIGASPRRIDIRTSVAGLTFDTARPDRIVVDIEGVTISVIGKKHLIRNKRALGRHQDLADIEHLGGEVDWPCRLHYHTRTIVAATPCGAP